ncbi:MAG: NADH-quinone oxidoreductase subunit C [Candidatus Omnitrophota bacterium]
MKKQEIIENIKVRAEGNLVELLDRSERRLYVTLKKDSLSRIAKYIFKDVGARFSTASGVDTRETVEILYHFSVDSIGLMLTLRVILDKKDLVVDSLAPIMKCAEWIEREIHEMFGVDFKGHPNLAHLLLKDDWPEGNYPLRRDSK